MGSNVIGVLIARGKAGLDGSWLQFQYSRSLGKRISSCLRPGFKGDAVLKGRAGGREGEGTRWRAPTGNAMWEDSKKRQPWSLTRNLNVDLYHQNYEKMLFVLLSLRSLMQRWTFVEAYLFNIKSYLFISSYFLITNITLFVWHYGDNRRLCGWRRIVSLL